MQEQIRQVAARIKELRETGGCSVESLAREFNISEETYHEYESGSKDIPISFLYGIAGKFNVELSAILSGENPRLRVYSVVRKGRGVSVERRKSYSYQGLACNFMDKKSEPFLVTVDPQPEGSPIHFNSHQGQEFNYLLEGSMKVVIDGHEMLLNEGDAVYFDSACKHGMKAVGDKPARFLAVII